MGKTAFIFPGQGAQCAGMGKDFFEQFSEARQMFELAGTSVGLDIKSLCFEEDERLNITEYTQIAMITTEIAMLKAVLSRGLTADVCAGLSLGEYGALVASGVMQPADCFRIVRRRGILMQEAYPEGGAMTAVIGMDSEKIEKIEKICEETEGIVTIANYNCPGQIVITGIREAVEAAAEKLKNAGAKKCAPLKVSGPFHSELLSDAGRQLREALDEIHLEKPKIPYVTNVDASYVQDETGVKDLLVRQISSPVRWQQSVECMIQNGVDRFIEIGPGKTLTGFMKRINSGVRAMNIATVEDLDRVLDEIK
ncbi:MAG: ACP S-malonyltransferase [Lachnospiraceae bacterium]|nr:ACP S-malonyltransferase [Lachnospiraceae bacterium]